MQSKEISQDNSRCQHNISHQLNATNSQHITSLQLSTQEELDHSQGSKFLPKQGDTSPIWNYNSNKKEKSKLKTDVKISTMDICVDYSQDKEKSSVDEFDCLAEEEEIKKQEIQSIHDLRRPFMNKAKAINNYSNRQSTKNSPKGSSNSQQVESTKLMTQAFSQGKKENGMFKKQINNDQRQNATDEYYEDDEPMVNQSRNINTQSCEKTNLRQSPTSSKHFNKFSLKKSPLNNYRNNGVKVPYEIKSIQERNLESKQNLTKYETYKNTNEIKSPQKQTLSPKVYLDRHKLFPSNIKFKKSPQANNKNSLLMSFDALVKQTQKRQYSSSKYSKSPSERRQDSHAVYDRLISHSEQWMQNKKEYKAPNYEELERLQSCTFQPEVSNQIMFQSQDLQECIQRRRNAEEFVQDQFLFKSQREERLEKKRNEIVKSSEQMHYIQRSRSNDNFLSCRVDSTERCKLLDTKKEERMKKREKESSVDLTFKPKLTTRSIELSRKGSVDGDVVKRLMKKQQEQQKVEVEESVNKEHAFVSNQSMLYIVRNLHKEFLNTCIQADLPEQINKEQFMSIFKQLGYLENDNSLFQVEYIWNSISRNQQQGSSLTNIKTFITALEGGNFDWMIPNEAIQVEDDQKQIGVIIDGKFNFKSKDEIAQVYKQFMPLILSRKRQVHDSILRKSAEKSKQISLRQLQQKSLVCKKSMEILKSSNINDKLKEDEPLAHYDLLMKKGMYYQSKQEKLKKAKDENEMSEVTFKPEIKSTYITQSGGKLQRMSSRSPSENRKERINILSQCINRLPDPRPSVEVEYENSKQECTFKPIINQIKANLVKLGQTQKSDNLYLGKSSLGNIISQKASPSRTNSNSQPNQIHKTATDMMKKSTSQSIFVQNSCKLMQKKSPIKSSSSSANLLTANPPQVKQAHNGQERNSGQSEFERTPILFLDVSLGKQQTSRIAIHQGDNVEQIIEEFAVMFGLSERKKVKLRSVVHKQLASYLHCIQEED